MIDDSDENYARIDGNPAVVLAVMKSSTAFTSEVSKTCNETIDKMTAEYDGLHFLNVMDQGDYIDFIVDSVVQNLVVGALLAIVVLILFLKDWRPTLVIGFSIPLSVLFAIVLMYFTDISFNMISLSGLALGIGMLVDNSIVSIENIYRLRGTGVPAARAAVQGAKQIAAAITASTLTTICVFLPILFTDGLTRELMMDMCLTIGFSLVASLVVALTVVPTMSATLLRNDKSREHRLFDKFVNAYAKLLKLCLRRKAIPLLLALALLVFSIWQVVRMGIVIIPEMGSEQMSVTVTMPSDTDNTQDAETADAIAEQLSEIAGIKNVGAMASKGTMALLGISGVESDSIKNIEYMIILDEGEGHSNAKIAKKIDAILSDMELEDYTVSESNMDMSAMLGSGLQVNISGKNLDTLLAISEDVEDMVKDVGGFEEISNGQEDGDKQISVVVDKDKAARLGLTVAQVYQKLAGAVTTEKDATMLTIENKEYTVTIVDDTDELELDDLMDYEFETTKTDDEGNQTTKSVKLKEFAKEKEGQAVNSINRDNQTRYISVTAEVADGYNTTLQSRELKKLIDAYDVPDGYSIEIAGESESTSEIVKNMALMMLLGFIFIYLIMVAQFQSLLSPFIVIFTIPLAFTGGLLGLLVSGEQLSLMSLMGFLILMGVVVNNGIVFVDYVNQLRIDGMSKREALVETGKTRMRPILMTAMTTIFAMATMIFSNDIGSDMSRGMAIVVVGGLLYATLMTLIIVPILYDIMFRRDIKVIDVDM
jgi:multidrug efflux pump subunit AcrB